MAVTHEVRNQRNQVLKSTLVSEGEATEITFAGHETKTINDAEVSPEMQIQFTTGILKILSTAGL